MSVPLQYFYAKTKSILPVILHLAILLPLCILIIDFYSGNLTAEPVQESMHRTGRYALILLLITLSCTPLKLLTKYSHFAKLRKIFGLYSFFYASIHFLIFTAIDYQFDIEFLREALLEKPYAMVGLFAYTLLIPLALTSNNKSMTLLRKNWKRIHRLIYVLTAAGIVHFFWLVKSDYRMPFLYAGIFALLLSIRLFYFAKRSARRSEI
jgi:sulfoxide reductase heme-binding subunit YedZ